MSPLDPRGFLLGQSSAPLSRGPSTVAVVMRTRDRPVLLRRAIGSVIAQTCDRWHLHIVNDGGDPAAVDALVAEHGAALGDRVTVLHNPDSRGMEVASNQALASADASCFAVHDDDDSWDPRFLAETTSYLDRPAHAGLVGVATGCSKIFERIEGDRIIEEERLPDAEVPNVADLAQLLVINRALPICLLFRMSLLEQLGGFNPDLPVIGDWEFNVRALLFGEIGHIPTALACYHMRRAPPVAAYANSVFAGKEAHRHYDRLVRNNVIRRSIAHAPELLGVLQPVVHAIAAARDLVTNHANRVAHTLIEQQNRSNAFLLGEMLTMLAQHEDQVVARVTEAVTARAPLGRELEA